ncbi:hypothetical protein TruAng_012157 [Truncatella angustata]|nr:hypothetical protein TruAng_012157 [Truncatella angustata]
MPADSSRSTSAVLITAIFKPPNLVFASSPPKQHTRRRTSGIPDNMASGPQNFYELYRRSSTRTNSVGTALTDTLDDLIQEHRIDPQLAMKILANFDRAITEVLQEKVRSRLTFKVNAAPKCCLAPSCACFFRRIVFRVSVANRPLTVQGSLDTYRFCDEVWTFQLKNVTFKMDNGQNNVVADKVKIVSCTAKPQGT